MNKIQVVVIDDQNIFRQILGMAINAVSNMDLMASYPDGRSFLDHLEQSGEIPDVVVMDIDMPVINGIELQDQVKNLYPQIKTIMLSQHKEEKLIVQLIQNGAAAYLDKDCRQEELILAIETVYRTGYYMNIGVLNTLQKRFKKSEIENLPENLSAREVEVLRMICLQQTNAEIADSLHLSTKTIDFHRANLLSKTNSRNLAGLVIYAIKKKIISI